MIPLTICGICASLLLGAPALSAAELPPPLQEVVAQAQADGLPAASLEAKAREGLAKGVAPARVAVVLERMLGDLSLVDVTLGELDAGPDRDAVICAAAAAHAAGLSDAGLIRLAGQAVDVRARALQASADLLQLGFSERDALDLVLVEAGSDDPLEGLSGLATAASVLVANGLSPGVAASRLASQDGSGKHPLANVPPQSRSDLPEPAQDAPGHGPKGPK